MRTTVTLDPDTLAFVRRRMKERGVSFKQALNDAIRAGFSGAEEGRPVFETRTAAMGQPAVSLDRAVQLAGELEDEELVRKSRLGK
ncbi:MAG: antitoxin [Acidimicrobiia bacterium]